MKTQNTKIHVELWHREFWLMIVANLLLSMSMTMLIPTLPVWMISEQRCSLSEAAVVMLVFGAGLYLPGCVCSWLVQKYRRNLVCVAALAALAALTWLPTLGINMGVTTLAAWRLAQGAAFGLAQMVLTSTLIIDTCESHWRTEANHSVTWFGRFAIALGPMTGILLMRQGGFDWVLWASIGCLAVAALLILSIHFPFRVPEDSVHMFSLDRFLLTNATPVIVNLIVITAAIGIVMAMPLTAGFYGLLMAGFLLALLAQRYVFPDAELKSEVMTGLLLTAAAIIILLVRKQDALLYEGDRPHFIALASPILGLGLGLIGTRFLLFFIKLSRHCQRGTSQSTFMLAWESGIAIGIAAGLYVADTVVSAYLALTLVGAALLMYHLYTHQWFVKHKNR